VIDFQTLLENYAAGPQLLKGAVDGLSEADLDAIPVAGKWSIRQVICHIADFEPISVDRMKRVLAEDNPTMFDADPNAFAAKLNYEHRNITEELSLIEFCRKHMVSVLRHCDIEDLQRTGVHSEDGPMTLETLVERVTNHIPHHIAFIEEKRKALASK